MESCRHIQRIHPSVSCSVLHPQKWVCFVCGDTESIWACLTCSHVACGKYTEEHMRLHFNETKHALVMDVHSKYVYCYECADYVLNDNLSGDVKILRGCLATVAMETPPGEGGLRRRSQRLQRSLSLSPQQSGGGTTTSAQSGCEIVDDLQYMDLWFRRYCLMANAFKKWKRATTTLPAPSQAEEEAESSSVTSESVSVASETVSASPPLAGDETNRLVPVHSDRSASTPPTTSRGRSAPAHPMSARVRTTSAPRGEKGGASLQERRVSSRRRYTAAGVTGLRNLGNTCYMNSILQVLRHLYQFSKVFVEKRTGDAAAAEGGGWQTDSSSPSHEASYSGALSPRSAQILSNKRSSPIGQGSPPEGQRSPGRGQCAAEEVRMPMGVGMRTRSRASIDGKQRDPVQISLSQELNSLLRVMYSGRLALVSPHKMLHAVWSSIPFFRGYSQQDAHEFLSEFLDKVQSEMDAAQVSTASSRLSPASSSSTNHSAAMASTEPENGDDVVTQLFQGELVSQVKCLACGHKSDQREAFMDLSLEFPDRYQPRVASRGESTVSSPHGETPGTVPRGGIVAGCKRKRSLDSCKLEEMLARFTEVEKLDGCIYACDACNKSPAKAQRTPSRGAEGESAGGASEGLRPPLYSEAEKCFLLNRLPHVLRLHLKRFMWSGRSHRGKISTHVGFAQTLDVKSYCHPSLRAPSYTYSLSAVVMHHGRGFGSGHYTAYCWNDEAGSWFHCNDAKMRSVGLSDVYSAQAYILIYTRLPIVCNPASPLIPPPPRTPPAAFITPPPASLAVDAKCSKESLSNPPRSKQRKTSQSKSTAKIFQPFERLAEFSAITSKPVTSLAVSSGSGLEASIGLSKSSGGLPNCSRKLSKPSVNQRASSTLLRSEEINPSRSKASGDKSSSMAEQLKPSKGPAMTSNCHLEPLHRESKPSSNQLKPSMSKHSNHKSKPSDGQLKPSSSKFKPSNGESQFSAGELDHPTDQNEPPIIPLSRCRSKPVSASHATLSLDPAEPTTSSARPSNGFPRPLTSTCPRASVSRSAKLSPHRSLSTNVTRCSPRNHPASSNSHPSVASDNVTPSHSLLNLTLNHSPSHLSASLQHRTPPDHFMPSCGYPVPSSGHPVPSPGNSIVPSPCPARRCSSHEQWLPEASLKMDASLWSIDSTADAINHEAVANGKHGTDCKSVNGKKRTFLKSTNFHAHLKNGSNGGVGNHSASSKIHLNVKQEESCVVSGCDEPATTSEATIDSLMSSKILTNSGERAGLEVFIDGLVDGRTPMNDNTEEEFTPVIDKKRDVLTDRKREGLALLSEGEREGQGVKRRRHVESSVGRFSEIVARPPNGGWAKWRRRKTTIW